MDNITHRLVPLRFRAASRRERLVEFLTRSKVGPDDRAIYGHLAYADPDTAVVFVHGFAGAPLLTWTRFADMLQGNPKVAKCDLFFYGYDSLSKQLGDISWPFLEFLKTLATNPTQLVKDFYLPDGRRQGTAKLFYERILIVAHSLGAVVTRRAILDAHGQRSVDKWVSGTRFMFFAPADRGASRAHLVSEALTGVPFGSVGGAAIKGFFPILDALEKNSKDLERLLEQTEEEVGNGNADHLKALVVVFADNEEVTKKEKFVLSERAEVIPGTTHTTVCKPQDGREDPLTYFLSVL